MSHHLERARLLAAQERHEQALGELTQHLGHFPDDANGHMLMAECLSQCERFDEATREAHTAVALAPDEALTHYALAGVLQQRNHLPEAQQSLSEAIRLDPENPAFYALQSTLAMGRSQWRPALEAAEMGLALDPENVACVNLRAMALVKLGRRELAGEVIEASLSRNPENAFTHANQGWTLLERGQVRPALEHFREALRLDPELDYARAGIVEAMKARNFIYRPMLAYFLWMARLTPRARWGVMIGGVIGYNVLNNLSNGNPALRPFVAPLLLAYIAFAIMTWIAYPLFNLMLRLDRFGRYALSRDQTVGANWLGGLLLGALISLGAYLATGSSFALALTAFCGFTAPPSTFVYRCSPGKPRKWMALYVLAMAACGLFCLFLIAIPGFILVGIAKSTPDFPELYASAIGFFRDAFVWGAIASVWVANVLASWTPRR